MAVAHAHARLTVSGVSEARFRRTAGDTVATSPLLCRKEMRQRLQTAVYALGLVPSGIVGHVQSNLQNVAWKISLYFCQCAVMFGCVLLYPSLQLCALATWQRSRLEGFVEKPSKTFFEKKFLLGNGLLGSVFFY